MYKYHSWSWISHDFFNNYPVRFVKTMSCTFPACWFICFMYAIFGFICWIFQYFFAFIAYSTFRMSIAFAINCHHFGKCRYFRVNFICHFKYCCLIGGSAARQGGDAGSRGLFERNTFLALRIFLLTTGLYLYVRLDYWKLSIWILFNKLPFSINWIES